MVNTIPARILPLRIGTLFRGFAVQIVADLRNVARLYSQHHHFAQEEHEMPELRFSSAFGGTEEELVDPSPSFFTLTPRTIRLGHGNEVFPLSNIARVGKYKVTKWQFPLLFIVVAVIFGFGFLLAPGTLLKLLSVIPFAVAAYGIWHRSQPKTFAFGFESNSGTTRFLYTTDENFISQIIEKVTNYIESDQSSEIGRAHV